MAGSGNITFSLPCPSVGKDPRTYNYLGEEAVKILEQEINYEMRMDYYRFLRRNKFKNGMMFTRATELYLEEHGMMELIPEETLLKSYFLWVKKVEKNRIVFSLYSRKHHHSYHLYNFFF